MLRRTKEKIYPNYSFQKGVKDGELIFFPSWAFYHNGQKFVIKLTWYPYPKLIDRMTDVLVQQWAGDESKSIAINAMDLVFGTLQLMKENWEHWFKISYYENEEEESPSIS